MAKSKYTVSNIKLKVRKSKTGKGLFADEDIPKGTCIIEYKGVVVPENKLDTINSKYLFEVGKKTTINGNIPGNTAKYINHSCKPNCEADGPEGHVYISAIRNIKAGEELFYDYGEEYFDEYLSNGRCQCEKCKKTKIKK
ncbi:MAG TPA: SET domain-containing protein [Parcubacteria group bacterium]|jgi:SET domain-containing protein|nr:SET domain-containing protein [Parcubacteria group bacterium]